MTIVTRRNFTIGLTSLPFVASCKPILSVEPADKRWSTVMKSLEARRGGRLGVVVKDLSSGQTYRHRADERFALCSTFKWMLGAIILNRVEAGLESLDRAVEIRQSDLVPYAPTTGPAVGGRLTIGELCAATIGNSDNPSANLLLRTVGGPEGFTQALRTFGDRTTRLDRYEPELNIWDPGSSEII
jgi:beta-lactamase class A